MEPNVEQLIAGLRSLTPERLAEANPVTFERLREELRRIHNLAVDELPRRGLHITEGKQYDLDYIRKRIRDAMQEREEQEGQDEPAKTGDPAADPLAVLQHELDSTEPTTSDFAWDWLMSPAGAKLRGRIDRFLRWKYDTGFCDITTRYWLDPLVEAWDGRQIGGAHNLYLASRRWIWHLVENADRFIDGDRGAIVEEVWDEIHKKYGPKVESELIFGIAKGFADAILFYRGTSGYRRAPLPVKKWFKFAELALQGYRKGAKK